MTEFLVSDGGFKYFSEPKKGNYVQGVLVSSPGTPLRKEKGFLHGNGCPVFNHGVRMQPRRDDCFECGADAPCAEKNTEGLSPELMRIMQQNRKYNEALRRGR